MRIFIKYIQLSLFLLAGVVLIAHNVVPHDHHLYESFTSSDSGCKTNDHGKHSGFPLHCHVLNDLAVEKGIKQVPAALVLVKSFDCNCNNELLINDFETGYLIYSERNRPAKDPAFYYLFPLRAPPVFV